MNGRRSIPPGDDTLDRAVEGVLASYQSDTRGQRVGRKFLPSRAAIEEVVRLFFEVFYPGYYGRQDLTHQRLACQIEQCLCFSAEEEGLGDATEGCSAHAKSLADRMILRIPEMRAALIEDIQAAYDGDPAAQSLDEIVLSYPGLLAVTVHRVAHELWAMGIPLMPRIMSEWAHARSGADIHPGRPSGGGSSSTTRRAWWWARPRPSATARSCTRVSPSGPCRTRATSRAA